MNNYIFFVLITILGSCSSKPVLLQDSQEHIQNILSKNPVKIISSDKKCVFLKKVETNVLLVAYPIFFITQEDIEKQKNNNSNALQELKYLAFKSNGNAISDIEEDLNISNWNSSRPLRAKVYKCNHNSNAVKDN